MNLITIEEYQDWTVTTAVYPEAGKYTERELNYLVHGFDGEAGELSNKFKKLLRKSVITLLPEQPVKLSDEETKVLTDELGDAFWYMTRICEVLGVTVFQLANDNRIKLEARKEEGGLSTHS